jgi:hypothetical protein
MCHRVSIDVRRGIIVGCARLPRTTSERGLCDVGALWFRDEAKYRKEPMCRWAITFMGRPRRR